MKLTNAFMNTFLISPDENNVFVENRVLSTDEEIENFTNQVFIGMLCIKQISWEVTI